MSYEEERIAEVNETIRSLIQCAREDGILDVTSERLAELSFGLDGEFLLFVNGLDGDFEGAPPLSICVTDQVGSLVHTTDDPVEALIHNHCPQRFEPGKETYDPDMPDFPVSEDERKNILAAIGTLNAASAQLRAYLDRRLRANP